MRHHRARTHHHNAGRGVTGVTKARVTMADRPRADDERQLVTDGGLDDVTW